MDVHCYCSWCYVSTLNILRRPCHQNDQTIDNQIYLINSTKTLSVYSLQQAHVVRSLSCLVCNNGQLERTTWIAPSYPSIFCISIVNLVECLVCLLNGPNIQSSVWCGAPALCTSHSDHNTHVLPRKDQSNRLCNLKVLCDFYCVWRLSVENPTIRVTDI